jgi:acetyl esterase/lipase
MRVVRRRVLPAVLSTVALLLTASACEVADPGPGETIPFGYTLPSCGSATPPPDPCLPAPTTYSYGGDPKMLLDVYQPPGTATAPRALIVYIHGGAWIGGSRADMQCTTEHPVCVAALQVPRGYVVASVDYRTWWGNEADRFPTQIADVKLAIKWLKDHASDPGINIDPTRVVTMGHSAGGHLASLAALTPGEWEPTPGYTTNVAGFFNLVGPTDFTTWTGIPGLPEGLVGCAPTPRTPAQQAECDALLTNASPLHWVDGSDVKGYLVTEVTDPLVDESQLWALHNALINAHGGDQAAAFIDEYEDPAPATDDDPHNPDTDLNLTAFQEALDQFT